MLDHNKRMQRFLQTHGIKAVPKYVFTGSLKGTWRLYGKIDNGKTLDSYQKWTPEIFDKLTTLGFKDFDGHPLQWSSGNGGFFSVFVQGHNEFLS